MGNAKDRQEVQLASRVSSEFRDQINADAKDAGCSVGALIMRMHRSLDPTARRRVEQCLGRLGAALNDAQIADDKIRDVSAALADLRSAIHKMIP